MEPVTMQGIFRNHFDDYARGRTLPLRTLKAARAIVQCRSPAMGGHVQHCPQGHVAHIQYHSCRHRSCTQCSRLPRAQWAEAQAARLLACDHYHVVFTLPHDLLRLWAFNRAPMASALFQAARETLMTLLQDERFLGATPGLMMTLHTWGRTLSHHPHIHCLVTGGGITPGGEWKAVHNGYLLPVRAVAALFRGKLLALIQAGLREGALNLPTSITANDWARTLQALYRQKWNVCLKERYPHGQGVLRYLARYVKGGPIGDSRLRAADAANVAFAYQDHHDGQHKTLTLATTEFLARVLWHVPEPGQHTVRHAGLYATACATQHARVREALGQPPKTAMDTSWQSALTRLGQHNKTRCPRCGQHLVRGACLARIFAGNENSILKAVPSGFAQHGVQADTPNVLLLTETGPPHASDIFLFGGVQLN
jgi:hypothetical protein